MYLDVLSQGKTTTSEQSPRHYTVIAEQGITNHRKVQGTTPLWGRLWSKAMPLALLQGKLSRTTPQLGFMQSQALGISPQLGLLQSKVPHSTSQLGLPQSKAQGTTP